MPCGSTDVVSHLRPYRIWTARTDKKYMALNGDVVKVSVPNLPLVQMYLSSFFLGNQESMRDEIPLITLTLANFENIRQEVEEI